VNECTLLNKMGSDLTVANAARVSFSNFHEEFDKQKDEKLIRYLAKNGHWSPFAHCILQYHIQAPIFVSRQLMKHQVGLSWNEVSRRYVDKEPEFYIVNKWRKRSQDKKQGSSSETIDDVTYLQKEVEELALHNYNLLLEKEVAPEQARIVLPQSMMTEWYWTGSLYSFARICNLRLEKSAQKETQDIAKQISIHAKRIFPISWKYLMRSELEE